MRTKVFLCTLMGCLVAPSIATAQDVYFSMGNQIRKLTVGSSVTTLVYTHTVSVGDLALCAGDPDSATSGSQYLYFVERTSPNRVRRLDINAAAPTAALVSNTSSGGEIRLTKDCGAVVGAAGLAIAFDGSEKHSGPLTAGGTIVGLGIANGGDGSEWPSTFMDPGDLDPNDLAQRGAICATAWDTSSTTVKCGPKGSTNLTSLLATFTVGTLSAGKAQYFEFLTNDVAYVATSVNPDSPLGQGADYNGILWRVSTANNVTQVQEVFRAPKVSGSYAPIVGVAVGKSNSQEVPTYGTFHKVSFGPLTVDITTPAACSLSLQHRQLSWADVEERLTAAESAAGTGINYLRDPANGGESWIDTVNVEGEPEDCGMSQANPAIVGLSQFNNGFVNKAVVKCDFESNQLTCQAGTEGNFPFSDPVDPRDSDTADGWSELFTAQTQGGEGNKILFNSPLSNLAAVEGAITPQAIANATSHNATGGLSIRFVICNGTNCKKPLPAEPPDPDGLTPITSGAGLSISALSGNGTPVAVCDVDDSGGSTPDRPQFRTSNTTHNFNLNTPMYDTNFGGTDPDACSMATLNPGEKQLFVATVFSNSGKFKKTSILFYLIK